MGFRFSTKKISVESIDNTCKHCGRVYPIFRDTSTSDSGPSLECEKCSDVVVFTARSIPNSHDLEKEYGPKKALKLIEDKLPPCKGCGGKLVFSDALDTGFPKKCPKCSDATQQTPQTLTKINKVVRVEKEMNFLGYHQDEKIKS